VDVTGIVSRPSRLPLTSKPASARSPPRPFGGLASSNPAGPAASSAHPPLPPFAAPSDTIFSFTVDPTPVLSTTSAPASPTASAMILTFNPPTEPASDAALTPASTSAPCNPPLSVPSFTPSQITTRAPVSTGTPQTPAAWHPSPSPTQTTDPSPVSTAISNTSAAPTPGQITDLSTVSASISETPVASGLSPTPEPTHASANGIASANKGWPAASVPTLKAAAECSERLQDVGHESDSDSEPENVFGSLFVV